MSQVAIPISQATSSLPLLIKRAACGEEIFIGDNGLAAAKLVAAMPSKPQRRLGFMKGRLEIPDTFFDPLPDDVLSAFGYGKDSSNTATALAADKQS